MTDWQGLAVELCVYLRKLNCFNGCVGKKGTCSDFLLTIAYGAELRVDIRSREIQFRKEIMGSGRKVKEDTGHKYLNLRAFISRGT